MNVVVDVVECGRPIANESKPSSTSTTTFHGYDPAQNSCGNAARRFHVLRRKREYAVAK
jgi:hypothetical protein